MPRKPRERSEGNIYHVVQRGVGQQILFEDEIDRQKYLDLISRYLAESEGAVDPAIPESEKPSLLAWCLMSNHIHMLLRIPFDELQRFMKRLGCAYARHYNDRHERSGHLFQDRYWSAAIHDDAYLMEAVRYIHRNPLEAGVADLSDENGWSWSSYGEYAGNATHTSVDVEFVLGIFGGVNAFVAFHSAPPAEGAVDESWKGTRRAPSDESARKIAEKILQPASIYDVKAMPKGERDEALVKMKGAGLSVRQIVRITGIGHGIVARVKPPTN